MDNTRPHRKLLRSPSVKRRSKVLPVSQRVQLQRVLGVTVSSNAGLSCDCNSGTIAYPAGCVVVLFNPRRNKQTHIFNATKKPITCVAFSRDGKYLITGETGHQPAVRIWDVQGKLQVAEFRGHKFGISCVAFSPNMKEVVSVGIQHDMMVNVWNWKTGNKVASNKVSSKVSALAFSEDGKCFITVGNRHVRFWYLDDKRSKINQTVPLMGRSGILGNQKDNFFCDVVAGQGNMCGRFFVISQSGLLCEFNEKRQLNKWVELRTKTANCITAGQEHIFVGCAEGVIRVFSAISLQFICSLPKPHYLGVEVTTATSPCHMVNKKDGAKYPDTKSITIDDSHKKVTCIYNDRSVYTWDVHDIKRAGKVWSFLYHSGCIWALEMYPPLEDETKAMLPPGSFLTASADDTIRVWNLTANMPENTVFKRNIYSNELLKVVYVDPSLTSLCSVNYNPAGGTDKTDTTYEGKNGVRSIRVSPDGADLASGDRQGNIRIYDMQHLNEKKCVEAHESDVMCLEYSYSSSGHFLATSSRDRLIHVFDVDENYGLVQSLGDHSSSITAVRFTDVDNKLQMISCGADKSILIRNAVNSPDFQFQLEHHLATKITLYDMVIDPTQKLLATACQDRNVRLYNIQTTKERKCYRGSVGDEGVLLRIHLDPSGSYIATTGTDKNVSILDFHTGELVATMYGHSEVITGVKFASDLRHLITVSADGCIFVWRLPSEMTKQIKGKLQELGKSVKETDYIKSDQHSMPNLVTLNNPPVDRNKHLVKSVSTGHISVPEDCVFDDEANHSRLDFSIGQLPNWAKVKFGEAHSKASGSSQEQLHPKGKWAQRADNSLEFKSQLDVTSLEDSFSDHFPTVESGFNTLPRIRRKTVVLYNRSENLNVPHVDDDLPKSTIDLHSSLPATTKFSDIKKDENCEQYKSDTSLNLPGCKRWSDRFALHKNNSVDDADDFDTESYTAEIIYPPTDSDPDLFAGTYKVFAVDDGKHKTRSSQGSVSVQDEASVSTDNTSVEDDDDFNDEALIISGPTSPTIPNKEFLPATPEKDGFARETFVEDSFTPVPLEKFARSVDTLASLERHTTGGVKGLVFESTPFSPRLSLSARFMSRAQTPSLKNATQFQTTFQQDNWFSKNKMEMIKAMNETRRSLLAMKLCTESWESDSLEKEDSQSPPIKLKEETITFPDANEIRTSYSISTPPKPESTFTDTLEGLPIPQPKVNAQSLFKTSPPDIYSINNQISENTQMRGSSIHPELVSEFLNSTVFKSSTSFATKNGPHFKPTQTFKNIANGKHEMSSQSDFVSDKPQALYNRKAKRRERLVGKKLFASTPNLVFDDYGADDNVSGKKQNTIMRCTSVSDLQLLSILSQNVSGVIEDDSNKCNFRVLKSPRPVIEHKQVMKFLLDTADEQIICPPQSLPVSSHVLSKQIAHSSASFTHDAGGSQQSYQKTTSKLAMGQAKNILSCRSSTFVDIDNAIDGTFRSSKSINKFKGREFLNMSSSAKKCEHFPPVFDYDLTQQAKPIFRAVTDNSIERTVHLLDDEKQTYICDAVSEFRLSQSSKLDASPLDVPERDLPNKQLQQVSSLPSLSHYSSHCLPRPKTFQHSVSSQISADLTYLISEDGHAEESMNNFADSNKVYADKSYKCKCITFHDSHNPEKGVMNCNAYCHMLPTSQESQTDTGVSSGTSDTDISHINLEISTSGTKNNRKVETFTAKDTNGQALDLSSSLPVSPVSVLHCQSLLYDYRSRLHALKDIFSQASGRTDEASLQILAMLGDVFHETHDIIADMVMKGVSQPQGKTEAHSSSLPHGCCDKTFYLSTSKSPPDETTINSSSSSVDNSIKEITALTNKSEVLLATKDMLQPIVAQLSHDLSEGIWRLIRERLD